MVTPINRLWLRAVTLAALTASPLAANAQLLNPAQLTGANRTALLIAGAKREGSLNLYTSAILEHMSSVTDAFEKKYGVTVRIWRGGSEEILQRSVTEARGGHYELDVVETAAPQVEAIARERLLTDVATPVAGDLMREAVVAGRPWFPARLIAITGAYNTRAVKPSDLPKTYDDLLDAKWKGRLGIESEDNNWLMAMADALGEDKALTLLRGIAVTNGLSVRKGHSLMANLVASGEVPVALTVYHHEVEPLKRAGAPIEELNLPPVIAFVTAAGVARRAPHPYAAVLFLDFLLSDGQMLLAQHGDLPTNVKVQNLPKDWKLSFIDIPKYMNETLKWTRLYRDVITNPR